MTRVPQSNATGIPPDMPPMAAPESPCIIPSWCAWSIARTLTEAPSQGRASMLWRGTRLPAGIITRYYGRLQILVFAVHVVVMYVHF